MGRGTDSGRVQSRRKVKKPETTRRLKESPGLPLNATGEHAGAPGNPDPHGLRSAPLVAYRRLHDIGERASRVASNVAHPCVANRGAQRTPAKVDCRRGGSQVRPCSQPQANRTHPGGNPRPCRKAGVGFGVSCPSKHGHAIGRCRPLFGGRQSECTWLGLPGLA